MVRPFSHTHTHRFPYSQFFGGSLMVIYFMEGFTRYLDRAEFIFHNIHQYYKILNVYYIHLKQNIF